MILYCDLQESEFHNDDDFEAVLRQLDTSQDIIQHTKEDEGAIKDTDNSENSEAAIKTGLLNY